MSKYTESNYDFHLDEIRFKLLYTLLLNDKINARQIRNLQIIMVRFEREVKHKLEEDLDEDDLNYLLDLLLDMKDCNIELQIYIKNKYESK